MTSPDPRARSCPRCGALNGADFDRCVRCGSGLSAASATLDRARVHVDGGRLWATKGILGLTLLVFAGQTMSLRLQGKKLELFGGDIAEMIRFGALPMHLAVAVTEPWRLLSAVFVHFGFIHLFFNMLSLVNLGRIAEPAVGTARFLFAYVLAGAAGFAATIAVVGTHGSIQPTAGASGAVLGVMGVILGWLVRRRDPRWRQFAVQALFYGVFFGFAANSAGIGVNNVAHIGGMVCGTILGAIFAGPRRGLELAANVSAFVAAVACVASLALAQRSPLWRQAERAFRQHASVAPVRPAPRETSSHGV